MDEPNPSQQLRILAQHLKLHGFEVHPFGLDIDDHFVITSAEANLSLTIRCRPRASDGGRQWFISDAGTPIAEADQIINAAMAVKGMKSAS